MTSFYCSTVTNGLNSAPLRGLILWQITRKAPMVNLEWQQKFFFYKALNSQKLKNIKCSTFVWSIEIFK